MNKDMLLLKIQNTVAEGKDFYEATRGNWVINENRLEDIKYVVAINKGQVVAVYQPSSWSIVCTGKDSGRKNFVGVEATEEIFNQIKKSQDELLKKFGAGNPVAYAHYSDVNE